MTRFKVNYGNLKPPVILNLIRCLDDYPDSFVLRLTEI